MVALARNSFRHPGISCQPCGRRLALCAAKVSGKIGPFCLQQQNPEPADPAPSGAVCACPYQTGPCAQLHVARLKWFVLIMFWRYSALSVVLPATGINGLNDRREGPRPVGSAPLCMGWAAQPPDHNTEPTPARTKLLPTGLSDLDTPSKRQPACVRTDHGVVKQRQSWGATGATNSCESSRGGMAPTSNTPLPYPHFQVF